MTWSRPVVTRFDDLESFVFPGLDAPRFLAQPAQLAESLHPFGLAGTSFARVDRELLLQRFSDELLECLAALGGLCLRLAKQEVRNLERRLHAPILPYLRLDSELAAAFRARRKEDRLS